MTASVLFDRDAIRDKFREWDEVQQPLDAELNESLAALSAFQAHLDAWQQELARERAELCAERECFGHERTTAEQDQARLAELTDEANASRDKVNELTAMLLSRTQELSVLDNRRAEAVAELELVLAREKELLAALNENKQRLEQERSEAAAETQRLRELLEDSVESGKAPSRADAPPIEHRAAERPNENRAADNPVLASVMEQFGKLRQQRAKDGRALKKGR